VMPVRVSKLAFWAAANCSGVRFMMSFSDYLRGALCIY
jgi:hypothetical protein